MNAKNFEQARLYALHRLEQELPAALCYHSVAHTRDEVVPISAQLADMEGLKGSPLYLLLTAAWFHDLGYAEKNIYHELISARIALEVLPGFGYTTTEVEVVRWAIFATILPQKPRNLLEQILADADLDVLGRADFSTRNRDLRQEFANLGKDYKQYDWLKSQIGFLESHRYFTPSARKLRNPGKEANIASLKRELANLRA